MNRNVILIIIFGLLLCTGVFLYFHLTKEMEIPDVEWNQSYNLNSDQPDAHKAFYHMLKKYYGDKNVTISNSVPYLNEEDTTKQLIIFFGDFFIDSLSSESFQLNTLFYSGHHLFSIGNKVSVTNGYYKFHSVNERSHIDSNKMNNESFDILKDHFSFTFSLSPYTTDTLHQWTFSGSEFSSDLCSRQPLIQTQSGIVCFSRITPSSQINGDDLFEGNHYLHSAPILFSNIAALQPWYVRHFNEVFSSFPNKKVILVLQGNIKEAERSPLEILLQNKGLKYAYFTLLATFLLYLIFAGKKIIRPVPVILPKENLSSGHIKTLARLYEVHGNNVSLVSVMKENFLVKISELFRVFPSETNIKEELVKRSGLEKSLIDKIFYLFEMIEKNGKCSDETMMELYSHLHTFYQKLKTL